jgi:hypothetical protein
MELEKIVGNEFYNANIQNWGRAECSKARAARSAIRSPCGIGTARTIKTKHEDPALPAETVITGGSAPTSSASCARWTSSFRT